MDLYFDLNTKKLWLARIGNAAREKVKIRQVEDLRLKFVRGSVPERLGEGATIFAGLKQIAQ